MRSKQCGFHGICTSLTKEFEETIHADEIDCEDAKLEIVKMQKKDPDLLSEYNNIIQSGIVERVPLKELKTTGAHYLPH